MSARQPGHRGRHLTTAVAAVLVAAAIVLAIIASRAQVQAAAPAASAAHPAAEGNLPAPSPGIPSPGVSSPGVSSPGSTAPTSAAASPSAPPVVGPVLARSKPVSLSIPAIGIDHTHLAAYGQDSHGAIAIPPSTGGVPAGWYTGSPTPGQVGPSVIVGHIDSAANGPSIFFHLAELTPGDTVTITLADHTVARFRVDSLEQYPKNNFPTQKVYGNINHAGLRLITCGGQFDPSWGHYLKNTVVYAHLISSHPA